MTEKKSWPESSQIDSAEYDQKTKTLTVTFKRGSVYQYADVPMCVWVDLIEAKSIGKLFNQIIKGVYDYELVS